MSTLQVSPENFNVAFEVPEEGQFAALSASHLLRDLVHLDSALPPKFARHVVERAISSAQPVPCKLVIEGKTESISLELTLRVDNTASGSRLISDDAVGMKLILEPYTGRRNNFNLDTNYAGLPISTALSYARFRQGLFWRDGTLYLDRLDADRERFELAKLPLHVESSLKEVEEDRVRFLEALDEIGKATGTEFFYPSKIEDDDLESLNHILKAIRGGWIALSVTDFTTPMSPEGVQNTLDIVQEEGAFGMDSSSERVRLFDKWVDLGPSRRYVSHVRLATRSEMEEWLASGPKLDDTFDIRWVPVGEARVHVFYENWPKPSLGAIREDIRAFEQETGKSSDAFRRAWEGGEAWAKEIQDGDVWLTLLDAKRHIEHGT